MKRIITISLLSSISILMTTQSVKAALPEVLSTQLAPTGASTTHVTPATLNGLEGFLRKNCGEDFPEIGLSAFCKPFKPEFSKLGRIDQIHAQTAAIGTIGQMVALAYFSFSKEIIDLKTPLPNFNARAASGIDLKTPLPNFNARAASGPEARAHYQDINHRFFLKFQQMITHLLELAQEKYGALGKDAKAALTQPYGSSDALGIAWSKDRNGIVPIPLDGKLKRIIYSSSTPYGDWGDNFQRSMVFIDGKLITSPGIYVHTKDGQVYKFTLENGKRSGFKTSPTTLRTQANDPLVTTLLESGVFRSVLGSESRSAFITMPETPDEKREFEAAFLEELLADLPGDDALFAEAFLNSHMLAIENMNAENMTSTPETTAIDTSTTESKTVVETEPEETAVTVITPPTQHPVEAYIDSLYEEQVLAEQEKISRQVAEGSIQGKTRSSKGHRKHQAPTAKPTALTEPSAAEKEALRQEILSKLKERGRTKWRTLARVLIAALKTAYSDKTIVINVTEKGSHFMLHIAGSTSSDGATIIRPHGKSDRTLSAGEARGLAENLIDLTFKLMVHK